MRRTYEDSNTYITRLLQLRDFTGIRVLDLLAAVLNFQIGSRGANEKFVPDDDQQMFMRQRQSFSNLIAEIGAAASREFRSSTISGLFLRFLVAEFSVLFHPLAYFYPIRARIQNEIPLM